MYMLEFLFFLIIFLTVTFSYSFIQENIKLPRSGPKNVPLLSLFLLLLTYNASSLVKADEMLTAGDDDTLSVAAAASKHAAYKFDNWKQLVHKWRMLGNAGLRLTDIEVLQHDNGKRIYTGVWKPGAGKHALYRYSSWKAFVEKWEFLNSKGYRLTDVERVKHGNSTWYYGVWNVGSGSYALYQYKSWKDFTDKWKKLNKQGQRLIDIDLSENNGGKRYVGVWRSGTGKYALYNFNNWNALVEKWRSLGKQGFQLIDMDVTRLSDGTTRYIGVWRAGPSKRALFRYSNWSAFKRKWASLAERGFALLDLEVAQRGDNGQWYIGSFGPASSPAFPAPDLNVMAQHLEDLFSEDQVVGMAYAISQHGQTAIAGSTGFAQRAPDPEILMTSKIRSTVASVSKALTAPLVYKLLADNGLNLDSPIAPWLPASWILGDGFENNANGIIFRHLLTHTSGLRQEFDALKDAGLNGPWGNGWDGLKFIVENGTVPDSARRYKNANFAFFRILIPELWASVGGPEDVVTKGNVGELYLEYMHELILDRAGIDSITCWPQLGYPEAKSYNFENLDLAGSSSSSSLNGCGGHANLHFSAQELVQYIDAFRYDNAIMSPTDRVIMDMERAGWNGSYSVTGGTAYFHGGAWNKTGGRRTRTCVMKLPKGVDAAIIINSLPPVDKCIALRNAFNAAMDD